MTPFELNDRVRINAEGRADIARMNRGDFYIYLRPDLFEHPGVIVDIAHSNRLFLVDHDGLRFWMAAYALELADKPVVDAELLQSMEQRGHALAKAWLAQGWSSGSVHQAVAALAYYEAHKPLPRSFDDQYISANEHRKRAKSTNDRCFQQIHALMAGCMSAINEGRQAAHEVSNSYL